MGLHELRLSLPQLLHVISTGFGVMLVLVYLAVPVAMIIIGELMSCTVVRGQLVSHECTLVYTVN